MRPSTTQLDHIGWTKDKGFITEFHLKEDGKIEIKIPHKSFVPALQDNKTMWGVKTQLKIIFPNSLNDALYRLNGSAIHNETLAINLNSGCRMSNLKIKNNLNFGHKCTRTQSTNIG